MYVPGAHRGQKRAPDLLELQVTVSHYVGAGDQNRISCKKSSLTAQPFAQSLGLVKNNNNKNPTNICLFSLSPGMKVIHIIHNLAINFLRKLRKPMARHSLK